MPPVLDAVVERSLLERVTPQLDRKEGDMPETLRELFIEQLKDIYDGEQRITKALPKMAQEAESEELSEALEEHLRETEEQVSRLEQILEALDETPGRKTCKAMVGLLEEGKEMMAEDFPPEVKDAGIIAAAQKVEHYEMATYGCLRTWADLLGEDEASRLLKQTLDEEGNADKKLTQIAQSLNVEATAPDGEEEEEEAGGRHVVAQGRRSTTGSRASSSKSRSR
jgi:ferritin-like metal-binding protein YciE